MGSEQAQSAKGAAGETLIDLKKAKKGYLVKAKGKLTLENSSIQMGLVKMASESVTVVVLTMMFVEEAGAVEVSMMALTEVAQI